MSTNQKHTQQTIQKYQSEQLSLGTTIAVKDSEVQPLKDKIAQLEQDRVTEKQGYQDSIQKYESSQHYLTS